MKANITALRRVRKTDNNRIARATGATIVNRVDDIQESDIGTRCGLFEIEKIGDEYFTFMRQCKAPKACTILLRGPSKDILNEIERNLQDAMSVARNVIFHPRLSPGGGAVEMAVSVKLSQLARSIEGVQQWPYKAVADAMEVIPRTLAQNAGASPIRVLTRLRAKHVEGHTTWGLDGESGNLVDMKEYGVWEPEAVKLQSIKTAVEVSCPRPSQFYDIPLTDPSPHACFSVSTTFAVPSRHSRPVVSAVETSNRRAQEQKKNDSWASGPYIMLHDCLWVLFLYEYPRPKRTVIWVSSY
jgi:T-complex protein 1 subunit gamma